MPSVPESGKQRWLLYPLALTVSAILHFLAWQSSRHLEPEPEIPVRIPPMIEITLTAPPAPKPVQAAPAPPAPVQPPKPVEPPKPKKPPPPKPVPKPKPKPAEVVKPEEKPVPVAKTEPVAEARPEPVAEARPAAPVAARSNAPAHADSPAAESFEPAKAHAAYLHNPKPAYPALARQRQWEGTVSLKVRVLASGRPGEVIVQQSSGHEALDAAAVEIVVQRWNFVPAKRGGSPVDSWVTVPIVFKLDR